jgi:Sec7-like guanine-nucleotide exchange factor
MKEITMSIHDFMEIQRGNLTLEELDLDTLDKIAGEILKNPKLKTAVITSIAYMNMHMRAYADEMEQLRSAKGEVVMVLQVCIVIICIVMCLLEIAKSLIGNRSSDVGSIVMKYLAATVGTCLVPRVFTWIAHLCGINV